MKREALNEYIGHRVNITFTDGKSAEGKLEFITEFCAEQNYRRPGYYAIGHLCFRCSHVKKLREVPQG